MMKTFNVGDKVRVVEAPKFEGSKRFIGKHLVVDCVEGNSAGGNVYFEGFGDSFKDCVLGEDLELAPTKLTKKRRIEALEKDVARQETEIAELKEAVEALKKPKTHADMLSEAFKALESQQLPKSLTPNQQRAQIIADAKQFVEQTVKNAKSGLRNHEGNYTYQHRVTDVHFVVKADEREVTAVAKDHYGAVVRKAIAKCAPDDVFNADIGKAIATGRLFNLDIERFINAVKPDEVVAGDVVEHEEDGDVYTIEGVYPNYVYDMRHSFGNYYDKYRMDSDINGYYKILDDTEAQYE